jgi:hypothetical protein
LYSVDGTTAATDGTVNKAVAVLWNPHTTHRIKAVELRLVIVNAPLDAVGYTLRRVTGRGTPTSTVTPNINNHSEKSLAPPSGCLLDLAWSTQPTIPAPASNPGKKGWILAPVKGSGVSDPIDEIIPPGEGLGIFSTVPGVVITVGGAGFSWREDW